MSQVSISRARLREIDASILSASNVELFFVLLAIRRRIQAEQPKSLLSHIDELLETYDHAITSELEALDKLQNARRNARPVA